MKITQYKYPLISVVIFLLMSFVTFQLFYNGQIQYKGEYRYLKFGKYGIVWTTDYSEQKYRSQWNHIWFLIPVINKEYLILTPRKGNTNKTEFHYMCNIQ